ncbi:MAG: peptidase caspase catalytic subunit p20 [Gammaproteobacteria bacterium]|nr:peptidase caspase catalytic subunit p20 [Gammaproteobacteria bacterium]
MHVAVCPAICVGTGVLSQALATDPTSVTPQSLAAAQSVASATPTPAPPPAAVVASPATPVAATPAGATVTPSVPVVKSDDAPFTRDEQLLLARGFHVVEDNGQFRTDHGDKIFCHREMSAGSRIASEQICGTAKQINDMSRETQSGIRAGDATIFQSAVRKPRAGSTPKGTDRDVCGHGNSQIAIASCTRIINDSRTPAHLRDLALRNRGWMFQSNGDLDRAIEDYTAVLKQSPGETRPNARTYVNRGLAYANKGDDTRALADYDQAVTLDPTLGSA